MASPTFNSQKIFDSVKADSSTFSEGVLFATEYTKILQKFQFNGEDGSRYLGMGWPDRPWVFKGLLSAPTISGLWTLLAAIEAVIDEADNASTTYHALVDSFGQTFDAAQVKHLAILDIHTSEGGTYVAHVVVSGVI